VKPTEINPGKTPTLKFPTQTSPGEPPTLGSNLPDWVLARIPEWVRPPEITYIWASQLHPQDAMTLADAEVLNNRNENERFQDYLNSNYDATMAAAYVVIRDPEDPARYYVLEANHRHQGVRARAYIEGVPLEHIPIPCTVVTLDQITSRLQRMGFNTQDMTSADIIQKYKDQVNRRMHHNDADRAWEMINQTALPAALENFGMEAGHDYDAQTTPGLNLPNIERSLVIIARVEEAVATGGDPLDYLVYPQKFSDLFRDMCKSGVLTPQILHQFAAYLSTYMEALENHTAGEPDRKAVIRDMVCPAALAFGFLALRFGQGKYVENRKTFAERFFRRRYVNGDDVGPVPVPRFKRGNDRKKTVVVWKAMQEHLNGGRRVAPENRLKLFGLT